MNAKVFFFFLLFADQIYQQHVKSTESKEENNKTMAHYYINCTDRISN